MTDTDTKACCEWHIDGGTGACCDPDDCGPCCSKCPTCPTLHRSLRSGPAYARRRNERGTGGLISGVVMTVLLLALFRVVLHVDLIGYLDVAADWTGTMIVGLGDLLTRSLGK